MNYTLREINSKIETLTNEFERGEITAEEFQASLDALEMKLGEKLEQIAYVRKEQKAYIQRMRDEKKRLDREIKSVTESGEWLDAYCIFEMERAGMEKFQGKFTRLSVCPSRTSAKVPINPDTNKPQWELIDPRFVGETVEPKLLKQEGIDHYERTDEIPEGFTIITDAKHLRITLPKEKKKEQGDD